MLNLDLANVEIDFLETTIIVRSKSDLEPKTKLVNFVGAIGTSEHVWKWGVIDHQPNESCNKGSESDVLQIEPEIVIETCLEKGNMEDEDISVDKVTLLQEIGMLIDVFEIGKDGNIPNDLLLCVKVLFMDEEEFNLYRSEMAESGFIMDEDSLMQAMQEMENQEGDEGDDDENEDNEEVKDKKPSKIPASLQPPKTSETKNEKSEGEAIIQGEDDDDEDVDMDMLPEITNEAAVFESLLLIADIKRKELDENKGDASVIDWTKAGVIRKPSLIGAYLKEIESDILNKFIEECKKHVKPQKTETKASKKRKLSDAKSPAKKKQKKK